MDKTKEKESGIDNQMATERLTADQYAVVEDVSEEEREELPELHRMTVLEVIRGRIREAFSPHGDPISPKLVLRNAPRVLGQAADSLALRIWAREGRRFQRLARSPKGADPTQASPKRKDQEPLQDPFATHP